MNRESRRLPVEELSVRLARLACDVDGVARAFEREHLTEADSFLLSMPLLHLEIATGAIRQTLWQLEHCGENVPVVPEQDQRAA